MEEHHQQNICEFHKQIETEVKKNVFLRKVIGNKIFLSVTSFLLLSLFSWGIWVTTTMYAKSEERIVDTKEIQKLSKDISEFKGEIKSIQGEVKNQNEKIDKNQQEILKLLLDIQREQKRRNGN